MKSIIEKIQQTLAEVKEEHEMTKAQISKRPYEDIEFWQSQKHTEKGIIQGLEAALRIINSEYTNP